MGSGLVVSCNLEKYQGYSKRGHEKRLFAGN